MSTPHIDAAPHEPDSSERKDHLVRFLAVWMGVVTVANVPGVAALEWYFRDAHGLARLGLAFGYMLYAAWGVAYLASFLLLIRLLRRALVGSLIASLPAALSAALWTLVLLSGKLERDTIVAVLAMTAPNVLLPVAFHVALRRRLRRA